MGGGWGVVGRGCGVLFFMYSSYTADPLWFCRLYMDNVRLMCSLDVPIRMGVTRDGVSGAGDR